MSLAVKWIGEAADFDALAPEWDELLGRVSLPFDLHCWYRAWWDAFGAERELAVCTVRRDGELSGVMPLLRDGRRLRSMANTHSPIFRPLAGDEESREALMRAATNARCSELELIALPEHDKSLDALGVDGKVPMVACVEPGQVSPVVETSGDFEAWRKQSKRRWGAPLERFRRKMARDHEAEFSIVEAAQDLDAELADGFAVEASGWKGKAGTAIVSTPETHAFYRDIAKLFARRGELRLSRIVLDGQTAAFDLCLLYGDRLYLLKTGFDERFRRFAPGLVMRLSTIERCFELGLDAHELLGADSEWKRKFATGARAYVSVHAYPKGPVGRSRQIYRAQVRSRLRSAYRRVRRRVR